MITLYGTVGKITNMKVLDGVYVYEVNNHDGFYVEQTLPRYRARYEKGDTGGLN